MVKDSVKRIVSFAESDNVPLHERIIRLFAPGSFTSTAPFRRLIEKEIDFEKIRRSNIKLKIIATDWQQALLEIFNNEDMTDAQGADIVIASGSLPGFFHT